MGPTLLLHLPTIEMFEAGDPLVQLVWSGESSSAEHVVSGIRSHVTIAGQPFAIVEADHLGLTVVIGGEAVVQVVLPAGTERLVGRTPDEPVEMRFEGPVNSVTVGVPGPEPCAASPPALVGVASATVGSGWATMQPGEGRGTMQPASAPDEAPSAVLEALVDVPFLAPRGVAALGGVFMGVLPAPAPPLVAPPAGPLVQQADPAPSMTTTAFGLLEPLAPVDAAAGAPLAPPAAATGPMPTPPAQPAVAPPPVPLISTPPAAAPATWVAAPPPPLASEDRTTVIAPLRGDDRPGGDHTVVRPVIAGLDLRSRLPPPAPFPADSGPIVRSRRCSCATLNAPGREHCRSCGAPLLQDRPLVTGPRPTLGTLEFDDGVSEPVDGPLVIGRRPPNQRTVAGELARTIQVEDPGHVVSGFHLEVRVDEWAISIVDYGSTNGTWITSPRGTPVRLRASEPTSLVHGCEVSLGGGRSFVYSET